jgi:hypothetical protein
LSLNESPMCTGVQRSQSGRIPRHGPWRDQPLARDAYGRPPASGQISRAQVRRDGRPFAASTGTSPDRDLQTSDAAPSRRRHRATPTGRITVSDGEDKEERTPSRLICAAGSPSLPDAGRPDREIWPPPVQGTRCHPGWRPAPAAAVDLRVAHRRRGRRRWPAVR